MKLNKILFASIFFLSAFCVSSQAQTILPPTPPSGNIQMLPEYIHERKRGKDSSVGEIKKKDGFSIRYDIGRMAGNYVSSVYSREKSNANWMKSQKINGKDINILYLKDGKIYATFPADYANFFATVKTDEELTDFLMIVFSYNPEKEVKD